MNLKFDSLRKTMIARHQSMTDILNITTATGGNSVFVAGGFVREFCRGSNVINGDVDLFISDKVYDEIDELQKSYGKQIKNPFGSDRWFPNENETFYYDIIKITDFYQGLWKCIDITDVLNQFDITANAVAFDLFSGNFYNPVNGVRDAAGKKIRAVRFDFPEMNVASTIPISRNSVLWFRYNHYSNKLGYEIETVTKDWIIQNAYRIADIDIFKKYFFNPIVL